MATIANFGGGKSNSDSFYIAISPNATITYNSPYTVPNAAIKKSGTLYVCTVATDNEAGGTGSTSIIIGNDNSTSSDKIELIANYLYRVTATGNLQIGFSHKLYTKNGISYYSSSATLSNVYVLFAADD